MASKKNTKDNTSYSEKKTTKVSPKSIKKTTTTSPEIKKSSIHETKLKATPSKKTEVISADRTKSIPADNTQKSQSTKSTNTSTLPKYVVFNIVVTFVILVLVGIATASFGYYRAVLRNQTIVQDFTEGSLDRPYEIPQEFLDTRVCAEGANSELTKSFAEGEYYVPNPPRRDLLIDVETESSLLVLVGQVFDQECKPLAGAIVDIWHTTPEGSFSLTDDSYRGYVFSDSQGIYIAQTFFPGADKDTDAGRIHFKIRANADSPVLTTQVFASIPNTDSHPTLPASQKVEVTEQQQGTYIGSYSFVVEKK